jgi:secondary thiamine-phosphate synthase enzyme
VTEAQSSRPSGGNPQTGMPVTCERLNISTSSRVQMISITAQISAVVKTSGVQDGICVVFCPHTTAGVTINENADPDVVRDIIYEINKVIPFTDHYQHGEGNSAAHIKSSLFSPSLTLIIKDGRLLLGTWQTVYFCEFDGPRSRHCFVKVVAG